MENEIYPIVVKKYKPINPAFYIVNYILNNTTKDWRFKYFQSFKITCEYDIKFTNIANNQEIVILNKLINMEFKSQDHGLNKKLKMLENNNFKFKEIIKLPIKIQSNILCMNIKYYLKLQIPIFLGEFFKIISQKPDYKESNYNDYNIRFDRSCRQWVKFIL